MEPLQNPPGSQEGRLCDPSLQALLGELAAFNTGLCVITTRLPVADIADHERTSAPRRDLEHLSSDAGAKLLRALGGKGDQAELRNANDEFNGHCLAMTLMGSYLTDAYNGDIRCRKEVSGRLGHDIRQGVHARKVMESYQSWFGEGPELSILRMLGLFDRPVDETVLRALLKPPAIPELTESLADLSPSEWRTILARLRRAILGARGPLLSVLIHFFENGHWGSPVETVVKEQSLTAEDQLFILMQAAQYLTAMRGMGATEPRICYERAEPLCQSLNLPWLLYVALIGQWRYSLETDKLTATMKIAERVYSLAQEQNDAALMVGAYRALAGTFFFLGDFESARQYATRGLQIWRSGSVQADAEEYYTPIVSCLCYKGFSEWQLGEIASCRANIDEAISIAKELNDTNALAAALNGAASLAVDERNPAEADRFVSDLIELATRHHFVHWLAGGAIYRGWAISLEKRAQATYAEYCRQKASASGGHGLRLPLS